MNSNQSNEGYSLLSKCAPARSLAVALGQELARAKLGDNARQSLLGRIYNSLSAGQQLACKMELAECRAARRGERLAVVA